MLRWIKDSIRRAWKDRSNDIYSIFGIRARTKEQKRLIRYFVAIKTITYAIIFILAVLFLLKLRSFGGQG